MIKRSLVSDRYSLSARYPKSRCWNWYWGSNSQISAILFLTVFIIALFCSILCHYQLPLTETKVWLTWHYFSVAVNSFSSALLSSAAVSAMSRLLLLCYMIDAVIFSSGTNAIPLTLAGSLRCLYVWRTVARVCSVCVFVSALCLYDHYVASISSFHIRAGHALSMEHVVALRHEIRGSRRYTAALDVRWCVISFFWSFWESRLAIFASRGLLNISWLCNVSFDTEICCELNMTDCIIKSF